MKNNECFVKLIPMNNINFLDLRKIAKNYYENGDLLTSSKSFSYLSFSIYDAINVCAIEKDDRLYEKMTNKEISLNGIDSIKDGFIAIKSSSLEVSNDDKGIIAFLEMCKNRKNNVDRQVKEYTFDVMSNDSLIIKYMNDVLDGLTATEQYFGDRYSPAYVVSETQPTFQQTTDFWFHVTGAASV